MVTLTGRRVLIVEDDYLLASDLAQSLQKMGAIILGPSPTLSLAEPYCGMAEAAVLDINLRGDTVYPLADELARRGVPFVFYTAYSQCEVPQRFNAVGRLSKPEGGRGLPDLLFPDESAAPVEPADELLALLPKLRLISRLMFRDTLASDRLVEVTLEAAIRDVAQRDPTLPLEDWLVSLLHRHARQRGLGLMN